MVRQSTMTKSKGGEEPVQLTERKTMASSCGAEVDEVTRIDGEAAVVGGGRRPRSAVSSWTPWWGAGTTVVAGTMR